MKYLLFFVLFLYVNNAISGNKYWYSIEGDWLLYFDNGKTYIKSNSLSSKCNFSRAYLSKSYGDDVYQNRMYSLVLSLYTLRKKIRIVLDSNQDKVNGSVVGCEFFGASEFR